MLSIYTLKSASDASKYYQQGDYYTQEGINEYSQWLGKGAKALNLEGPVNFEVFKNLLEGRLPNGQEMIQVKKGQYHRPGYDLTFSAPKSVSILALVGGNDEVLSVHREAIQEVVAKIEEKYSAVRNHNKGKKTIEKTGNLIAGAFEHIDSRDGDPNLHTHVVLMNVTQKLNGEYRTLYGDELYEDKLLNGMEYRSLLAHKLLKLGYELRIEKKGTFEIAAVPLTLIELFSKRREAIVQWLKDKQLSGGLSAMRANFETRREKKSLDTIERLEGWISEMNSKGYKIDDLNKVYHQARDRGAIQIPEPYILAQNAVQVSVEHLSEKKNGFKIEEVIKTARLLSIFPSSDADFLKAIEQKITDKELCYTQGKWLTTSEILNREKEISNFIDEGKNSVHKISADWIANLVAKYLFKEDTEQQALKFILTSTDRHILLNGSDKEAVIGVFKSLNSLMKNHNHYPRFLVQKAASVQKLKAQMHSERVSTIEGFLLSCEMRLEKRNPERSRLERWNRRFQEKEARDIWIVNDEVSIQQVFHLQQYAKKLGARLIFWKGHTRSNYTFEKLKQEGISEVKLTLDKNQPAEQNAKEEVLKAIEILEKKQAIYSFIDYEERIKSMIQLSVLNEKRSSIIALTHRECLEINSGIRTQLKTLGNLKGNALQLTILESLGMSRAEKSQLQLYQIGDVIRFNRELKEYNIKKDAYFEVKRVDLENEIIELTQDKHNLHVLSMRSNSHFVKHMEVFRASSRELMIGDTIIWTRSLKNKKEKSLNRIKGEKAEVISIQSMGITIRLENGKIDSLDKSNVHQCHWDYGYASLLHQFDIGDSKNITLLLQNQKTDSITIKAMHDLWVEVKQNKCELKIVCDDCTQLKKNIEEGAFNELTLEFIQISSGFSRLFVPTANKAPIMLSKGP